MHIFPSDVVWGNTVMPLGKISGMLFSGNQKILLQ